MYYRPVRTIAPATKAITLEMARNHCRVDYPDDDVLLDGLIDAAIAYMDGYGGILGGALINQTWRQDYPSFNGMPLRRLRLPFFNAVSPITSVQYYDGNDAQQTVLTSVYDLNGDYLGPYVELKHGQSWPAIGNRTIPVSVTFVAGYGTTPASIPANIRLAMLMLIAHWYENRETVNVGNLTTELEFTVAALIAPHRRVGF